MAVSGRSLLFVGLFALLLTASAFALVPPGERAEYWPEGSPEASVHNYILAIKRGDLDRGLTYISCGKEGVSQKEKDLIEEEMTAAGARVSFAPWFAPCSTSTHIA